MPPYRLENRILQIQHFLRTYRIIIFEIAIMVFVIFGMNSQFEINKNFAIYNSFTEGIDLNIQTNEYSFEIGSTSLYDRFGGNEMQIKSEIVNSDLNLLGSHSYAQISSNNCNFSLSFDLRSDNEPTPALNGTFFSHIEENLQFDTYPINYFLFESSFYQSLRFDSYFQVNGFLPINSSEILINEEFATSNDIQVGNQLTIIYSTPLSIEAQVTIAGIVSGYNSESTIFSQPIFNTSNISDENKIPLIIFGISNFSNNSNPPLDYLLNNILDHLNQAPWNTSINYQYGISLIYDRSDFYSKSATITLSQINRNIGILYQNLPNNVRISNYINQNLSNLYEITENFRIQILLMNLPVILIFLIFLYLTFFNIIGEKLENDIRWFKLHGKPLPAIMTKIYAEIAMTSCFSVGMGYFLNILYNFWNMGLEQLKSSYLTIYRLSINPSNIDFLLNLLIFFVIFITQALIVNQNIPKFFHSFTNRSIHSKFYQKSSIQKANSGPFEAKESKFGVYNNKLNTFRIFWQGVRILNWIFLLIDLIYLLLPSTNIVASMVHLILNPYMISYLLIDCIFKILGSLMLIRSLLSRISRFSKKIYKNRKIRDFFRIPQNITLFRPFQSSKRSFVFLILFSLIFAFSCNSINMTTFESDQLISNLQVGGNLQSQEYFNSVHFYNSSLENQINENITDYFDSENKKLEVLTDLYIQNGGNNSPLQFILVNMTSYLQVIQKFSPNLKDPSIYAEIYNFLTQFNVSNTESKFPFIVNSIFQSQLEHSTGDLISFQIYKKINATNIGYESIFGKISFILDFFPGFDHEITNAPLVILPYTFDLSSFEGFGYSIHLKLFNMVETHEEILNTYNQFLSQFELSSKILVEPNSINNQNSFNLFELGNYGDPWILFKILNRSSQLLFPVIWVTLFMIILEEFNSKKVITQKMHIRGFPSKILKNIFILDYLSFLGLFSVFFFIGIFFIWLFPLQILKKNLENKTNFINEIRFDGKIISVDLLSLFITSLIALIVSLRGVLLNLDVKLIQNSHFVS